MHKNSLKMPFDCHGDTLDVKMTLLSFSYKQLA